MDRAFAVMPVAMMWFFGSLGGGGGSGTPSISLSLVNHDDGWLSTALIEELADESIEFREIDPAQPEGEEPRVRTLVIPEEQMVPATALCACGVAFFLRAVRAASQGGIEIGFHPGEALTMAAQTALGAASLVLEKDRHPEREIDSVTTPRGCTIAGLNEMEHQGLSSALIRGITVSAEKAEGLANG